MESRLFVFIHLIFMLLISNLADSWKEDNDGIFKDLGLEENDKCNELNVTFPTSHKVLFGNTLKLDDVKVTPKIQVETFQDSKFHTLVMVDPDAPSRTNPVASEWLHWLVSDIPQGQGIIKGQKIMTFAPSGPPKNTGKHRYIFLLFSHNEPIVKLLHLV